MWQDILIGQAAAALIALVNDPANRRKYAKVIRKVLAKLEEAKAADKAFRDALEKE